MEMDSSYFVPYRVLSLIPSNKEHQESLKGRVEITGTQFLVFKIFTAIYYGGRIRQTYKPTPLEAE